MRATIIAATEFYHEAAARAINGAWFPDSGRNASDAAHLVEFAGRACFQSWHRPNPGTARVWDYIKNLLGQGHFSVLEHAVVSCYITGVSRNCGLELRTHRHFSRSELSQRYVDVQDANIVYPPDTDDDSGTQGIVNAAMSEARWAYAKLVDALTLQGLSRKRVRQAARAVMPGGVETRFVMTGNHRAWRDMISKRATEHADEEIRLLAVKIGWQLKVRFPDLYQDMHFQVLADGREVAYFGEEIADGERLDAGEIPS